MKRLLLLLVLFFSAVVPSGCASAPGTAQVTVGQLRPVLATTLQTLILKNKFDASYYEIVMAVFDSLFVIGADLPAAGKLTGG